MASSNPIPNPASSFTLFPLLPPELRLKIWTSTFTPRILELRLKHYPLPNHTQALHISSYIPPPTTLSITCESRQETLRHYHLSFPSKDLYTHLSPQIYINFSLDTIYLDSATFDLLNTPPRTLPWKDPIHPLLRFLEATSKRDSDRIRYLGIDEKIWLSNSNLGNLHSTGLAGEREGVLRGNVEAIRRFGGLREVCVVHHGVGISVPCAYSYLRDYEISKIFQEDKTISEEMKSLSLSPNHPKETFIRYLDKPLWTPQHKPYPPVLRGDGMGIRNPMAKKQFDERYNERGQIPIYGWELEELERAELKFFEIGDGQDFMDGVERGCVEEDRRAVEREVRDCGGGWIPPVVRSVGLVRGGREC